jgi:6-pyruvoyltetrahydropterin/6-carboxytetrahydropterin synthase
MDIFKVFFIEAAHRLPNVPTGHKCERLHGHSYRVEVHVSGRVGSDTGWVIDFADIQKAFQPLFEQLDHHYLNEVEGLPNPTSENIARWIWDRLQPGLPALSKVVIHETCTSGCIYEGRDD